jgi:signal peptidase I
MNFRFRPGQHFSQVPRVTAKKRSPAPRPASKNVVAAARTGGTTPTAIPWRSVWENTKSILGAILIFLFIRTFLVEAYRIPSPSMVPTLLVGDWLFVNKLRFGPHIPFSDINLPGYAEPHRNDVVVFVSPPQDPSIRMGPDIVTPTLVKRLVGQGGDTLHMRDDMLYVNGVEQRQGFGTDPAAPVFDTSHPLFERQKQYEVRGTRFPEPLATPSLRNWGPIVVPPDHFFMLGDNRHQSIDSRYYGFVPRKNIRGRPLFVYYSYRPSEESDRALPGLTAIRWSRLGDWIR